MSHSLKGVMRTPPYVAGRTLGVSETPATVLVQCHVVHSPKNQVVRDTLPCLVLPNSTHNH